MATKEHKTQARGLIEGLECRVHSGPPIHAGEIHSARAFLDQHEFSPLSDYHNRLNRVASRLAGRATEQAAPRSKRNYGGEAAGRWVQVQSAYDHVILSTCYEGELSGRPGRIKLSHRFNRAGRIEFVELKYLRSPHACLNGELRKLLLVKRSESLPTDWRVAPAFVLEVMPRELVFLYDDLFHCPRGDVLAWLVNIGHRLVEDMLQDMRGQPVNGHHFPRGNSDQLCVRAVLADEVALPILEQARSLECSVLLENSKTVEVRYRTGTPPAAGVG